LVSVNVQADASALGIAEPQFIMERNGLKDGAEFVVRIGALAKDVQGRLTLANAGIRISRMRLLRLGFLNRPISGYAMLVWRVSFRFQRFFHFSTSAGRALTPFERDFFPFGRG